MQKTALPLVACLLALSLTGAHAQTLWKWRDASGQLHISDTAPPAGTPAKNIVSSPPGGVLPPPSSLTAAAAAPATPAASTPGAVSSLDKKKAAADQEKADKEKADRAALDAKNAAARKENCASAQASLAGLQSGQRIARINDKGEREVLDDSGRADEIKRVQGIVASNCGAASAAQ